MPGQRGWALVRAAARGGGGGGVGIRFKAHLGALQQHPAELALTQRTEENPGSRAGASCWPRTGSAPDPTQTQARLTREFALLLVAEFAEHGANTAEVMGPALYSPHAN